MAYASVGVVIRSNPVSATYSYMFVSTRRFPSKLLKGDVGKGMALSRSNEIFRGALQFKALLVILPHNALNVVRRDATKLGT